MAAPVSTGWKAALQEETRQPYYQALQTFLKEERAHHTVFPPQEDVFNALRYTPIAQVKVVILGQDPYHDVGQAHGLAFSVRPGVKPPPSLVNILRELHDDTGARIPNNGCLIPWAEQGVLLLNTVLTVRAHEANSHHGKGWEAFTDAILRVVIAQETPAVFVLWGNPAQKKRSLLHPQKHPVIASVHPSPLSASRGFFGSRPFSRVNAELRKFGMQEINWQLPEV